MKKITYPAKGSLKRIVVEKKRGQTSNLEILKQEKMADTRCFDIETTGMAVDTR